MKRVQLAGGTFDVESFLVGLVRELRVDTSNDSLRLHDGVKVGGYEILNRDQNNALYQPRAPELDGFNFGAQEKGILCRVGPATYRIRRIEVNEEQLVITNPRGTLGNILIEFADTITSDHTFSGLITFTQPIAAEGGVVGNVVGNVTGDLTGNSFGTHTGPSFGLHTGGIDTRGEDIIMDDDQLPENAIHQLLINRGIPYGGIIMWSGVVADIPESWALCDGTDGTPDLRSRFIVGAGTLYTPHETGGNSEITLEGSLSAGGAHTHPLSIESHALTIDEIPAHKHLGGIVDGLAEAAFNRGTAPASPDTTFHVQTQDAGAPGAEGYSEEIGGGEPHTHAGATTESGAHSHDITLEDAVIIPPYYALCYIMKIAPDA